MRCTVCLNPQVTELNTLLASGTSARKVAHKYGIPRTTLARHARHIAPTRGRFGVIEGGGGSSGPSDPLSEAFQLAERARTPRERLRALEQVRAATKLSLRGVGELDSEQRDLLHENAANAAKAYRDAGDFETAARALSGWREAIQQMLEAERPPDAIEVQVKTASGKTATMMMKRELYFKGVPQRFRDPDRYDVARKIQLSFERAGGSTEVKVYDRKTDALVWATPRSRRG